MKKILLAVTLVAAFSLFAVGQDMTARAAAHGKVGKGGQIALAAPHACTLSHSHPCVYYGGDINLGDPNQNGLSNENTAFIPQSYTYTEVKAPVSARVSAAFSNNLASFGVLDPQTATWQFRSGVSEGSGGTLLCSGDSAAMITDTHRNDFGFEEFEVVTKTPCTIPAGNVWLAVTPDCTNAGNGDCTSGRYFESNTDGTLNAINGKFTITSNTGMGPTFDSEIFFGFFYASWCNDLGICGDGMSFGVLK